MATRYWVIENTPGYLPEDDQFGFDGYETLEDAKLGLKEVVDSWQDERAEQGAEPCNMGVSDDGTYAWMDGRPEYTYDLGRVASIEITEG